MLVWRFILCEFIECVAWSVGLVYRIWLSAMVHKVIGHVTYTCGLSSQATVSFLQKDGAIRIFDHMVASLTDLQQIFLRTPTRAPPGLYCLCWIQHPPFHSFSLLIPDTCGPNDTIHSCLRAAYQPIIPTLYCPSLCMQFSYSVKSISFISSLLLCVRELLNKKMSL